MIITLLFHSVMSLIVIMTFMKGINNGINYLRRKKNKSYFKNNVMFIDDFLAYKDVSKSVLEKFNTNDINELKTYFYNKFLEFENAYNNLDYNMMKMLSTEQMYENYYTGISLDLKAGRKRIIKDIEKKKVILFDLSSSSVYQTASLIIKIKDINYKIDKNGYIISGNRYKKLEESFEVVFRKKLQREDVVKCPNCGAQILGNKCEYCRTIIKSDDFKINSIKKIIDNE